MAETRYSEWARAALERAVTESEGMQHNYVGQEHLLLALASGDGASGEQLFAAVEADGGQVRDTVRLVIGTGEAKPDDARPRTPRMAEALARAEREAEASGHRVVEPGHLLVGILDEGHGIGAAILGQLGVTAEWSRAAVRRLLEDGRN